MRTIRRTIPPPPFFLQAPVGPKIYILKKICPVLFTVCPPWLHKLCHEMRCTSIVLRPVPYPGDWGGWEVYSLPGQLSNATGQVVLHPSGDPWEIGECCGFQSPPPP